MTTKIVKYITLFVNIFVINISMFAIDGNKPVGGKSEAMANSSITIADIWSIYHNQAGLANLKNMTVGAYFGNKYFVKELSLKSIAFVLPTKTGVFGVNYTHFGYSLYSENKIALAYARKLGKYISMGIQLDYLYTKLPEDYGKKGTALAEVGIRSEPIKNLVIAAHVFNIWQAKIADYDNERIPTIFKIGMSYTFSDKVLVSIQTDKNIYDKPIFKAGVEINMHNKLFLRTGISSNPYFNTFGIGYNLKNFQFDLSFEKHQTLGYSSSMSITYKF